MQLSNKLVFVRWLPLISDVYSVQILCDLLVIFGSNYSVSIFKYPINITDDYDKPKINVSETRRGNQQWTIQISCNIGHRTHN